jgi:hypothetical protein
MTVIWRINKGKLSTLIMHIFSGHFNQKLLILAKPKRLMGLKYMYTTDRYEMDLRIESDLRAHL